MALTQKQKDERRNSIGGSDASKIMWGDTAAWRELYDEKVKGIDPVFKQDQIDRMDMGSAMEPLTLAWFEREHKPLRKLPAEYRVVWKVDPFFTFTPDAITLDGGYPVQAKFHMGDKDIMTLAEDYGAQLMHEMLCTGTKLNYLVVTFGHYGRRQHLPVEHDRNAEDVYLERAMAFKQYILTGKEPEWFVQPMAIAVPRRRDHVWDVGDNMVADLAMKILENKAPADTFAESLAELKTMVPDDAATATWVNNEGIGIKFKVSRSHAKSWSMVVPNPFATPAKVTAQINPRARRKVEP